MTRHTNRLADQTSPYLRQHAGNPVDWYPWGAEALARARREDKPIFLSIGYSACHWCHVMERECFEDATIAALMNRLFVCIKVDREERPDLDEIYMAAVQAMTGQGGWPMSVWLTPDLEPFFGGTYFPPEDALGRPGFPRVCEQLARAWRERRDDCVQGASEVRQHLAAVLQPAMTPGDMPDTAVATLLDQSASRYDDVEGGFAPPPGFAPKFPHAAELAVLLRMGAAGGRAAAMVARTLDRMAAGGICDQVGGGFHRYSTDRQWLVPHFEKMLYDNAQLVGTYLEAARRAGNRRYGEVAGAVLDYMLRELQSPAGGFFSSQDADSDGEEGKFFVWQRAEFDALLGTDADLAADHFGVTIDGNWEHRNVLVRAREPAELASRHGLELAAVDSRLAAARAKLFAARAARTHPATDDKVLAAWNGLAIEACARGYQALGDRRYLEAARRAAAFVLDQMIVDGRLRRSWHSGRADHPAFLEDHAFVADALLTLFECDGEPRWLEASRSLLQALVRHYRGEDGSFHTTADDHEELIARPSSAIESSTPSGTAGAVRACLRGGLLLGDEALYGAGVAALRANAGLLRESPIACPSLVLALEFHRADPREIVIAGAPDDPRTMALLARARAVFGGDGVIAVVHDGNRAPLEELSPVFAGKVPIAGRPAVYVCRRGACAAPITEPDELRR